MVELEGENDGVRVELHIYADFEELGSVHGVGRK